MAEPADEKQRVRRLRAHGLLNSPSIDALDRLAALGAGLFKAPICLVSLIGDDRQWFKGRHGLATHSTPRDVSFCAHTLVSGEPLIVPDATRDARFAENALVTGDPGIRFYAGAPIVDEDGVRLGALCVIDTVPREPLDDNGLALLHQLAGVAAEQIALRGERDRAAAVEGFAGATGMAVVIADSDGVITSWNHAASTLFGYPEDEALGAPIDIIIPERFREAHHAGVKRMKGGAETKLIGKPVEVHALRRDGSEFAAELTLARWPTRDGFAMGAHISDITTRKAREGDLEMRARSDGLTGLLNLASFQTEIDTALASDGCATLLTLDLDGFKQVNDTLGHAVGDALLQTVAIRLRAVCGPEWHAARLGGDEFAVVSTEPMTLVEAHNVGRTLLEAVCEPYHVSGYHLNLSTSIGLAIAPDQAGTAEELLDRADLAMFRAKRDGGRRIRLFDASMRGELAARHALKDELRTAHSDDQWTLHYQPQVRLSDGTLTGVEALLRWRHPHWGVLMPAAFMPVLETHLLAYDVGGWILNEACRQLSQWRMAGIAVPRMSVNLFSAQLHMGTLRTTVHDALSRHGLSPHDLELEITETIALNYDDEALAPLFALIADGVGVALDDFGTGFASLVTLKRFPLTRLKIDKSFITDLCEDIHSQAVVKGLLSMGETLGIEVIAEGVEEETQRAKLRAMGCDEAQGFLFSKALAGPDFGTWRNEGALRLCS